MAVFFFFLTIKTVQYKRVYLQAKADKKNKWSQSTIARKEDLHAYFPSSIFPSINHAFQCTAITKV